MKKKRKCKRHEKDRREKQELSGSVRGNSGVGRQERVVTKKMNALKRKEETNTIK